MPRNGSNVYSVPAGTTATPNTTIESSKYNAFVADIAADQNTARPIVAGGTGATTAAGARTALGLAIGSDVQAYDADTAKTDVAETVTANWTFNNNPVFSGNPTFDGNPKVTGSWLLLQRDTFPRIDFDATGRPSGSNQRRSSFYVENTGHLAYALRNDDGIFDSLVFRFDRDGGLGSGISVLTRDTGDARYVQKANLDLTMTDVTGSRTHSTSYQNTSGQTQVVQTYTSGSGAIKIQTSPDNSTWTDVGSATSGGFFWNNMFHVPNGSYWRINGSVTVGKVYEGTVSS